MGDFPLNTVDPLSMSEPKWSLRRLCSLFCSLLLPLPSWTGFQRPCGSQAICFKLSTQGPTQVTYLLEVSVNCFNAQKPFLRWATQSTWASLDARAACHTRHKQGASLKGNATGSESNQAGLELTEMYLSLPPERWRHRHMALCTDRKHL